MASGWPIPSIVGTRKQKPTVRSVYAIRGNGNCNKLCRPKVSMVKSTRTAKTKLTASKPSETNSAGRLCSM